MAISMSAFLGVCLSLLLVSVNAGAANQQTRQSNLRQAVVTRQSPEDEQEVVTREDIIQQNTQPSPQAVDITSAMQPALMVPPQMQPAQQQMMQTPQQLQLLSQQQQQAQAMQAEKLLQAQALQMQQMQKQLQQQQQELQKFEKMEKQQQEPKPQQAQVAPPQPASPPPQRAPTPKKSLVGVKAQVQNGMQAMTKSDMEASSGAGAMPGAARPKGWDQCLKFARFVKAQDVTGTELVRTWKSTCEPAVQSGRATERYKLMCNSLSGVIEPYAAQIDYDVEMLCDSVLAVFHDVTAVDAKAR